MFVNIIKLFYDYHTDIFNQQQSTAKFLTYLINGKRFENRDLFLRELDKYFINEKQIRKDGYTEYIDYYIIFESGLETIEYNLRKYIKQYTDNATFIGKYTFTEANYKGKLAIFNYKFENPAIDLNRNDIKIFYAIYDIDKGEIINEGSFYRNLSNIDQYIEEQYEKLYIGRADIVTHISLLKEAQELQAIYNRLWLEANITTFGNDISNTIKNITNTALLGFGIWAGIKILDIISKKK